MKILTICRGIPGSGKSFIANAIAAQTGAIICSTDNYFIDSQRVYRFDQQKLGAFHKKNQDHVVTLMQNGVQHIVVDNTNIKRAEMKPYIEAAERFGYEVQYVSVHREVETCVKSNTHNVPPDIIRGMAERFHYDHRNPEKDRENGTG